MSTVTGMRDGITARKRHRCCLCGEPIQPGEIYDSRTGISSDGWWTMHMHPECHDYESPQTVESDWYEDVSEPAFQRPKAEAARS